MRSTKKSNTPRRCSKLSFPSQQSNVSELQSQSTELVQESSTDRLSQSFQVNAEAPQDILFSPLNPVSVKETEDLRILTHNDVKTLDTSRMSNLKEKNELLFSKVRKAINGSFIEKLAPINNELQSKVRAFENIFCKQEFMDILFR